MKPITGFVRQATLISGYQALCKVCKNAAQKAEYRRRDGGGQRGRRWGRYEHLTMETVSAAAESLGHSPSVRDYNGVYGNGAGQALMRRVGIGGWAAVLESVRLIPPRQQRAEAARKEVSCAVRFQVFSRDKFRCVYCGDTPDRGARLTIDHILPVSAGGSNIARNLRTACWECNSGKGAMLLELEHAVNPSSVFPRRVSEGRSEPPRSQGPSALGTDAIGRHPVQGTRGEPA